MKLEHRLDIEQYITRLGLIFFRLALAPRRVLVGLAFSGLSLAFSLIVAGAMLYHPVTFAAAAPLAPVAYHPQIPAHFTPLASPPPAFAGRVTATPAATRAAVATTTIRERAPEASATPTSTAVPLESLLTEEARGSRLAKRQFVSVLLLGTDSRPDEDTISRSDSMVLALLDLTNSSAVLVSIPRDLWVFIPGYGEAKINTAYFLGELRGRGAELAAETVSNLLNIPVNDTIVVDFHGFRALIDMIGGIEIDVPEPIDDAAYPDDYYGTFRLVIPAGRQVMDGERALQYARTRHGSSDILRAERQQAVLEAVRRTVLTPAHLPNLPAYLLEGTSYISTSLSLPDLFFLARFGHSLPSERIHSRVIRSPLLWNGVTADGQQILLYNRYSLQQAIQEWLSEAAE